MDLPSLEAFLTTRLGQPLPGPAAHSRFAPHPRRAGWPPGVTPATAREAAALILIYPGAAGPNAPLTVRHLDLPHHPGQVSLPGGRLDPDETAERAALRETFEEIGVRPEAMRVVGPLSTLWVDVSGFVIQPFVAVTDARPEFRLAAGEVETLIEVPVADLHDRARLKWASRTRRDTVVTYPYFDVGAHAVWGATAMILGEFGSLFDPDFGPTGVET